MIGETFVVFQAGSRGGQPHDAHRQPSLDSLTPTRTGAHGAPTKGRPAGLVGGYGAVSATSARFGRRPAGLADGAAHEAPPCASTRLPIAPGVPERGDGSLELGCRLELGIAPITDSRLHPRLGHLCEFM